MLEAKKWKRGRKQWGAIGLIQPVVNQMYLCIHIKAVSNLQAETYCWGGLGTYKLYTKVLGKHSFSTVQCWTRQISHGHKNRIINVWSSDKREYNMLLGQIAFLDHFNGVCSTVLPYTVQITQSNRTVKKILYIPVHTDSLAPSRQHCVIYQYACFKGPL